MEREQATIRLPAELKEKLQQEADSRGYSLKDLLIFIFNQYLAQNQTEPQDNQK